MFGAIEYISRPESEASHDEAQVGHKSTSKGPSCVFVESLKLTLSHPGNWSTVNGYALLVSYDRFH